MAWTPTLLILVVRTSGKQVNSRGKAVVVKFDMVSNDRQFWILQGLCFFKLAVARRALAEQQELRF